jgi:DNA-binding PadR family transcriptional regulator
MMILIALSGRELYGRELVQRVNDLTEGKVKLSLGGLYTTLHRMEQKKIIVGRWGETTADRDGARRRYYKITGLGERVLAEQKQVLQTAWALVPERA